MSINKTSQTLDHQLANRIAALEQQMKDIKVRQPIGAGNLVIESIPSGTAATAGPITLAADAFASFQISASPVSTVLTQWDFETSIQVDGTTFADFMPGGANMTTGKLRVSRDQWVDWALSDDTINKRVIFVRLHNQDTASHQYYLSMKAYIPLTGGGITNTPGVGGG